MSIVMIFEKLYRTITHVARMLHALWKQQSSNIFLLQRTNVIVQTWIWQNKSISRASYFVSFLEEMITIW